MRAIDAARLARSGKPVMSKMLRNAAAALAASAVVAAGAGTARAQETSIKFSLDFKFEGPSAPFLVPLDKGYYKAEK